MNWSQSNILLDKLRSKEDRVWNPKTITKEPNYINHKQEESSSSFNYKNITNIKLEILDLNIKPQTREI